MPIDSLFLKCLENLSNEEHIWEEIMKIKTMPISMAHKKELKAKLKVSFIKGVTNV